MNGNSSAFASSPPTILLSIVAAAANIAESTNASVIVTLRAIERVDLIIANDDVVEKKRIR